MLSCRDFAQRYASDFIDRQLGWRERARVRFHLFLCDNCRRFAAQLRVVRALLRRKSAPAVARDAEPALQSLADRLHAAHTAQNNSPPPL